MAAGPCIVCMWHPIDMMCWSFKTTWLIGWNSTVNGGHAQHCGLFQPSFNKAHRCGDAIYAVLSIYVCMCLQKFGMTDHATFGVSFESNDLFIPAAEKKAQASKKLQEADDSSSNTPGHVLKSLLPAGKPVVSLVRQVASVLTCTAAPQLQHSGHVQQRSTTAASVPQCFVCASPAFAVFSPLPNHC